ncbi:MAG: class A beta-lactamase [Burkholderiales bacterium]|nr:class A beta-lactamase [Burkholderiales bacterium]
MQRRQFIAAFSGLLCATAVGEVLTTQPPTGPTTSKDGQARWGAALAALEAQSGGRLGVAVLDLESGQTLGWRADERFAMCSTFKFLLGAAVLARVDRHEETLARAIPVTEKDLLRYAPFSKTRIGATATVAELCEAMLTLSDNTAANLLLASVGGPGKVTRFVRAHGDATTRLDRYEPALNDSSKVDDDPRDTTTPKAMIATMRQILVGDVLSDASRKQLIDWMTACKTGDNRLRAGLPMGWKVGDKTGTGDGGTANDIAIIWPNRGTPILVTSYLTHAKLSDAECDRTLAKVGAEVVKALAAYNGV